jgi:hypothetical protein
MMIPPPRADRGEMGTKPFQTIWEYFDQGHLGPVHKTPGPLAYVEETGNWVLKPLYEHTHLPG